MAELKDIEGGEIVYFFKNLPPKYWVNAHSPGKRYGELSSNIAKNFNS